MQNTGKSCHDLSFLLHGQRADFPRRRRQRHRHRLQGGVMGGIYGVVRSFFHFPMSGTTNENGDSMIAVAYSGLALWALRDLFGSGLKTDWLDTD